MGIVAINAKIYANMLSMFTYMIALAAANATQIIVGHSVGAHDYDFAYRRVLKTLRFGNAYSAAENRECKCTRNSTLDIVFA